MNRINWSRAIAFCITLGVVGSTGAAEKDERQRVKLPTQMRAHMLGNMRDHLQALSEIQAALAAKQLDRAADIAETRLGMTSLGTHGAAHMAQYMPKAMQDIGTEMHHAASRFALMAQEGDGQKALENLVQVTQQCVACHAGYRVY
ncbi:MAG: cytochrome c [Hydrogenophilales bacterium]|nr:cytochrome c [Hydrogenophilales bacterium]